MLVIRYFSQEQIRPCSIAVQTHSDRAKLAQVMKGEITLLSYVHVTPLLVVYGKYMRSVMITGRAKPKVVIIIVLTIPIHHI